MNSISIVLFALSCILAVSAWGHHEEHHEPIPYKYEYGVKDPHTHDHKSQWEHGDGHHDVKGGYKFDEADGTHREVEYHGGKGGTNTIVKRVGHAYHPDHKDHDKGHGHGHASSYANYNQYPHGQH